MSALNVDLQINNPIRAILIVLLLSVLGVMRSYAYRFSAVCSTGQTLYYNITDETNHYVELTYPNFSNSNPWGNYEKPTGRLVLPETVTFEGVTYLVTSIGYRCFYGCEEITSVIISNSILTIGVLKTAFWTDPGAFSNCINLSEVVWGNSLASIGDGTFYDCVSLTTISIPETITYIGYKAFDGCGWYNAQPDGLLYLSNCCLGYKGPDLTGSLSLADNTRLIADFAFALCKELTGSLEIPNSVKHIGNGAFSNYIHEGSITHPRFTSLRLGNSVTTIGNCAFAFVPFQGNLELPNSLTSISSYAFGNCTGFTGDLVIPNSLTTIGGFSDCTGFTGNLIIPNSVTTIEGGAFRNCTGFNGDLVIPNSVTTIEGGAFRNCTGFNGELVIPNSVTSIGDYAFQGCTGFNSRLMLSNSISSIGDFAFANCDGIIGEITIPVSVTHLGKSAFKDCGSISDIRYNAQNLIAESSWSDNPPFEGCNYSLVIGNGVETIPSRLFKNSGLIGDVVIPNSVVEIGGSAFQDCDGLTGVAVPESVNTIGYNAFAECTGLTSVNIMNVTIGDGMFSGCTSLSSVTISGTVTSIGNNAFQNCYALESLSIPNNVQQIGAKAFSNCSSLKTVFYNAMNCSIKGTWLEGCTAFNELHIGNNVQSIPSNSFSDCEGLTNVVLPESLMNIGACAFKGCSGLASINIPGTVESIGGMAFYGCQNLTSVIIPKSLNDLGTFSFGNCSKLTNIYYQAEHLESGSFPFDGCPSLATLYIDPCVLDIGSEVFRHCQTIHFVVAMGDTPAQLGVDAFADFTDNMVLMVSCGNRVTYYSVWNMIPFNNIIEDCNIYSVESGVVGSGGDIFLSKTEAQMGEEVQITVNPNPGMRLASLAVCNVNDPTQIVPIIPADEDASTYSFYMPPFGVVVMASFATGTTVDEINSGIPVVVYPNPTKGIVKIEAEGMKSVIAFNLIGQQIFDGQVTGNEFEFDFSNHEAGVYLIRIETASGVAIKRVILKN